jgi:putative transposase
VLSDAGVRISLDGKGAWRDSAVVERFWRTIKCEEVYVQAYTNVPEARAAIGRCIQFFNSRRPHTSLDG